MTDVDSEIEEDVNTPLADVTDDSCVLQLIEIVPLDRTADDDHKPEVIPPLFVLDTEDLQRLQDVEPDPADDYNAEDPCFTMQVRSAAIYAILCVVGSLLFLFSSGQTAVKLSGAEAADRAQYAAPD